MPKIDRRSALALALQRAGFQRDTRASEAYSLSGQQGRMRVDFGRSRSKSARFQRKHESGADVGDTYYNVGDLLYFGYLKTETDVDGWARYFYALAMNERGVSHPPIPQKKAAKPETVARREQKKERTEGRGFYVVNETGGVMTFGRLAANHGPFQTLDEAVPVAWRQLQEYLEMKFTYLLPVKVVEARSKKDAERGHGHVWWIDGRMKGEPVPVEQERFPFANQARGARERRRGRNLADGYTGTYPEPIAYVIKQDTSEGPWTSEVFTTDDMRYVHQNVDAGHLLGGRRWAETVDGTFLFGRDPHGKSFTPPKPFVPTPTRVPSAPKKKPSERTYRGWVIDHDKNGWLVNYPPSEGHGARYVETFKAAKKVVDDYLDAPLGEYVEPTFDPTKGSRATEEALRQMGHKTNRASHRVSDETLAKQYKARARAERKGGGSIRIDTRVPEVLIVRSTGEERYFQDWQADELIAEMKRAAGKMLDYMSLEDFILAASQSW